MLEELVKNKKTKYEIDLNSDKNYSCWILKEMKKDKNNQKLLDNKNIISYGALSLYLQKINIKKRKANSKYYEIRLSNLSNDIFPFERNPEINFIYYNSNKENLFGSNIYEKKNSSNLDIKYEEYKKNIINSDIPEMILYKYKYDNNLFQEIIDDSDDEANFIFNIIKSQNKIINLSNNKIIKCINSLLDKHKKELYDIPFISQKKSALYKDLFTEEEVITILSLYDALYIQFKLKQKKIIKLFNQTLLKTNNRYKIDYSYINNAQNELDLDLALSYIGFLITIFNNNSKNKFCNSLMDININLNSKKLLQTILEDECDKITEQFCLSTEDVVYNLKVLKKEITGELKEPNNECQLMDICLNKVNELSQKNKKYHPIHLLQKAINFQIISLASHPYIAKIIFETYFKIVTISTSPTEKGKSILNSLHPSYRCKRIENCSVEKLITVMKNNENNFSELYLDIEKCENEGLINVKFDIDLTNKNIEDLVSLLNKAINGFFEEKKEINNIKNFDNMSESDENESTKNKLDYKKNVLARKIIIKNMIIQKEFTQKYFINYIKKKLHNIAEKLLIRKISKKFYSIITRKYIKNENGKNDDDTYYYSIFFLNQNTFCCISIDKNKKIKYHNIFKSYFVDNQIDQNKKLSEINELKKEFLKHRPKYIILGINNIASFQLIEYLKENFSKKLIYSDYLSLLSKPKYYENNFNDEEYYYHNIALDQFKFTVDPLYFFIENYNFKYEKNLILNLKLDPLQNQINDISLLNYCLETQIRSVININKLKFPKEKNAPENYFCFMNGLGPLTGKIIEDNKNAKSIEDIQEFMKKNIFKNFQEFLNNENDMEIDSDYPYNSYNNIYNLNEEDIFNKVINSFYPLKVNSIHNVMVNDVDIINNNVNCFLFYNENIFKCKLPFNKIPDFIVEKEIYFQKYRIILCKIIDIKINENEYLIILTNKLEDLEYCNELSSIEEESYLNKNVTHFNIKKDEDYKLPSIEKLKNIINIHKDKNNKFLKNRVEDRFLKNICLEEIKKEIISSDDYGRFYFRPSFLGENHLFLTFKIIESLTLNYDILIDNNKKYILNDIEYQSIDEIVTNFANKLLKTINEFKTHKFFKSPNQMKLVFNSVFDNINNKTNNFNKNYYKDYIILCFMEDSPNYGLLFTITQNNNYIIDYIEFLTNGYNFHNIFFENISLVLDYYNENYEKDYYKEFIYNQIIYNIHSQIEDIDMVYDSFTNEKELENINWNFNEQRNEYNNNNKFLGKKVNNSDNFNGWKKENDISQDDNSSNAWGDFNSNMNNSNNNLYNNQNKKENNKYNKYSNNKNDDIYWNNENNNNNNFDSLWNNNEYSNKNVNENENFWEDTKNIKYNNNQKKDFNENDTDIISSEKIQNNNQLFNMEENKNNYLFNNNDLNDENYNIKKNNFQDNSNNKNILDIKEKNKYNDNNNNNIVSNFSWGTEQNNKEEEKMKEEKNENNKSNNINNDYILSNNNNGWENFKNKENEDESHFDNLKSQNNICSFYNKNKIENYNKNNLINDKNSFNDRDIKYGIYNINNLNLNKNKINEQIFNCSNNKFYKNPFNNNNNFNKKINYNNFNNNRNHNSSNDNSNNTFSFNNNNNSFHSRANKKNNKSKKGNWKDELYNNEGKEDIKDESEGNVVEFENANIFGGFNLGRDNSKNKDENKDNQEEKDKII